MLRGKKFPHSANFTMSRSESLGCTMSKCRDFRSKEAAKVIVNDEKRRRQQREGMLGCLLFFSAVGGKNPHNLRSCLTYHSLNMFSISTIPACVDSFALPKSLVLAARCKWRRWMQQVADSVICRSLKSAKCLKGQQI